MPKIEIRNGKLYMEIDLSPQPTCGVCGTVYPWELRETASQQSDQSLRTAPPELSIFRPQHDDWEFLYVKGGDTITACPTCAKPIRDAKEAGDAAKRAAHAALVARVVGR